ncbi:hypothetical protein ABZ402_48840 [Streptomyces mirabilis]|uniref:hypothetical protein n=1 Tax=Streptomyces mirabilis TaxID=68239 RepID=UPI0033D42730
MGEKAVSLLLERIAAPDTPPRHILGPPRSRCAPAQPPHAPADRCEPTARRAEPGGYDDPPAVKSWQLGDRVHGAHTVRHGAFRPLGALLAVARLRPLRGGGPDHDRLVPHRKWQHQHGPAPPQHGRGPTGVDERRRRGRGLFSVPFL